MVQIRKAAELSETRHFADVAIVGAGLFGLVTAQQIIGATPDKTVHIIDIRRPYWR